MIVAAPADDNHSRLNEEHYRHCPPCYDDHLDFIQEQEIDTRIDKTPEGNEHKEGN